jgi:hypothetical protein
MHETFEEAGARTAGRAARKGGRGAARRPSWLARGPARTKLGAVAVPLLGALLARDLEGLHRVAHVDRLLLLHAQLLLRVVVGLLEAAEHRVVDRLSARRLGLLGERGRALGLEALELVLEAACASAATRRGEAARRGGRAQRRVEHGARERRTARAARGQGLRAPLFAGGASDGKGEAWLQCAHRWSRT